MTALGGLDGLAGLCRTARGGFGVFALGIDEIDARVAGQVLGTWNFRRSSGDALGF